MDAVTPGCKQDLLDYFSSLSYDELAEIYEMVHPSNTAEVVGMQVSDTLPPQVSEQEKQLTTRGRKPKMGNWRTIPTVDLSRICPFCESPSIYKHGLRSGMQRYRCTNCRSVFTPNTNTVMSYSHKPSNIWESVIADTVDGTPLENTADRLGINKHTVFNMRHKIMLALAKIEEDNPTVLSEVTELDETYVLESQKGTKLDTEDRLPRQRGGKAKKRGLSNEQVCLFAGVQRDGAVYMKCVNHGKPSKDEIIEAFEGHVTDDAMYMTDGLAGYSALKQMASCQVVNAKKEESAFYHINHVNNLHSQFKNMYEDYRGVATKYINRYLILMSKIYKTKSEIINAIWNSICEMTTTSYRFTAKDVEDFNLCDPS